MNQPFISLRTSETNGKNRHLAARVTALALAIASGGTLTCLAAGSPGQGTVALQSSQLEETPEAYQLTLNVPQGDSSKIHATLEGNSLRVTSGQTASGAQSEQSFYLPAADPLQTPSVSRDKTQVVISVAKARGTARSSSGSGFTPLSPASPAMPAAPNVAQLSAFQQQVMQQFAQMQKQMDAMMADSNDNNDNSTDPAAALVSLFGRGLAQAMPASSGGVTVEDNGTDYIIRANNLDAKTKLNISVDNGNVLKITTSQNASSNSQILQTSQSSNSTQVVTLPSAVAIDKMTSKREGNSMVFMLPKA